MPGHSVKIRPPGSGSKRLPDVPGGPPPYGRVIRQKEDPLATWTIERARTRISPPTSGVAARLAAAAAATALPAAACASTQRPGDTGSIAKANAICAQAVARHDAHPFPLPGFDPMHPRPADLPAVGRYFAQYARATATTSRLDAIAARRHISASGRNCAPSSIRRPPTRGGRSPPPNAPTSPDSREPRPPRGTCPRRSTGSPPARVHVFIAVRSALRLNPVTAWRATTPTGPPRARRRVPCPHG